jgi:hypothetical protein
MPFNIATFRQHLTAANSHMSRFSTSSIDALDKKLATLGAAVGPGTLDQIEPLWVHMPHDKQQKYLTAVNYLKTFVPGLADAIPVAPTMHYLEFRVMFMALGAQANYPARFYHVHELRWKSSNGHTPSLKTVGTRERVTHRSSPAGPPFDAIMNANIPMAFTQGATTNSGADGCSCKDDHSTANPALIVRRPLGNGSVIADQDYEYTTDGVTWRSIPDAQYVIEKGVRAGGGGSVFFFRKQSASPAGKRFHFEVEYPIGAAHAVPGNRIAVIPAGFASAANLRDHASRVVSKG